MSRKKRNGNGNGNGNEKDSGVGKNKGFEVIKNEYLYYVGMIAFLER